MLLKIVCFNFRYIYPSSPKDLGIIFFHLKNDALNCLPGCKTLGLFVLNKLFITEHVKIQNFIIPQAKPNSYTFSCFNT